MDGIQYCIRCNRCFISSHLVEMVLQFIVFVGREYCIVLGRASGAEKCFESSVYALSFYSHNRNLDSAEVYSTMKCLNLFFLFSTLM